MTYCKLKHIFQAAQNNQFLFNQFICYTHNAYATLFVIYAEDLALHGGQSGKDCSFGSGWPVSTKINIYKINAVSSVTLLSRVFINKIDKY